MSTENPEKQIEGLQSLEKLVDNDAFLPDAPLQHDHILAMIYARYGMLSPDLSERQIFITRALSIAKKHSLLIPKTELYISLAINQAELGFSQSEQQKTLKKALSAAETAMDAGASAEAVSLDVIANMLITKLQDKGDFIGIEKVQRRLAARGLKVRRTAPSAMNPEFN